MPIYEFYCPDCHMLFSFLARVAGARKRPDCPRCGRPRIERRASAFAVARGGDAAARAEGGAPDAARLESALSEMSAGLEGVGDDPRRAAGAMRGLLARAGMRVGGEMEEALVRLEAGEDPERIDQELGDDAGGDEAAAEWEAGAEPGAGTEWTGASGPAQAGVRPTRAGRVSRGQPRVDDRLYEL